MEYATLIVMLALVEYIWFTARVGAKRGKHGIKAPATTGHEQFERAFRVQQNTLEELIIFIPAAFSYAWFVSAVWVLAPGALFLIGRLLYSSAYMKDPAARGPGFGATVLANIWLVVGTLIAVVSNLL
jgi:glutathione S-transferase